jgi:hypothetical protein
MHTRSSSTQKILRIAAIALFVFPAFTYAGSCVYSQPSYYSQGYYQGNYYSQSSYYSEAEYYSQGSYYGEGSYYSQGYYQGAYWSGGTFSFEYEANGLYCVRVTVEKRLTHPRTIIHSDGYSTSCEGIGTSARPLQRSVELTY